MRSSAALSVVAAVLRSVQPAALSWEATDGMRAAITTGATGVAGFVRQTADRIRYRDGIAVDARLGCPHRMRLSPRPLGRGAGPTGG